MENGKREQPRREPPRPSRPPQRKRRRRGVTVLGVIGRIILAIFTVALIGVLSLAIFAKIFMQYIDTTVRPNLAVSISDYTLDQSSIIYYHDENVAENDGWVEYNVVHGAENRIEVTFDQLPDAMWQAAVAIEDHRFFQHHGVDWRRTLSAVKTFVTGGDTFGASTITQQVLRNITQDTDVTINRKLREIFRALEFEKNTTKQKILERYLNTIYLDRGCYGVQTAARYYFGKDVWDLSVAECASIIAITNNPSLYGPMSPITIRRSDGSTWTPREFNKYRQELVLDRMCNEEVINPETGKPYLTKEEAEAAKAEVLHFTDGSIKADDIEAEEAAKTNTGIDNWFVEQVKNDVAKDLMVKYNVGMDYALSLINRSGYKIYATVDPRIQEIAESVYRDRSNMDVTSSNGQLLQSGITIVENTTGNVVAIVGAIGEKEGNRVTNFATMKNQVGSSMKPLTCYAPALEAGVITPGSVFDNYPVQELEGSPWPKNSPNNYTGFTSIKEGVRRSWNTIAVQTLQALGLAESYAFATEKLNLDLVSADMALSPLGMGGLTYGLSTEEMAAAFASFANGGIYNAPRTYFRVEDLNGNIVLENNSDTRVAMKDTTAYLITDMLLEAVNTGTGTPARISGMNVAGKTGTTNSNYIRYFAGYTPYYTAAVWTGFQRNAVIPRKGNPAVDLWKMVMEKVHEGLENKSFPRPASGLTSVELCADSGLRCTDACRADIRGSRARTWTVAAGTAPTEECTLHTVAAYCSEGQCLAGELCPEESVTQVGVLDYERVDYGPSISADDDQYLLSNMQKAVEPTEESAGGCPVHGEGWVPPVTDPILPGEPNTGEPQVPGEPGNGTTNPGTGNSGTTNPGTTTPGGDPPPIVTPTEPVDPPSVDPPDEQTPPTVPEDPGDNMWGMLEPPPA